MQIKKLESILKYGIYAVVLMPLIVFSDFVSPFHFGKVVVFRAAIELLAIPYLVLILSSRKYLPKPNFIFWAFTAFTFAFGLTSLTSANVYQSIMGTLERMGGWFTFLHFWVFFVMLISIFRTEEDWWRLIKLSVLVSLASTLYGFLQKTDASFILGSGGRNRIFGTLGNPALFAGYEIVNIFFAFAVLCRSKLSQFWKYLYISALVLDLLAVFLTAVRGSVLGIFVGSLVFFGLYAKMSDSQRLRRHIFGTMTALILGGILLIAIHNTGLIQGNRYLSRILDISLHSETANTRFWAWQSGIDGWNDSFKTIVFGWGPENFNVPFSKHFNPQFFTGPGSETLFDRAHNMFVEVLVTMGLLGFLAYASIFVALFMALRTIMRSGSKEDRLTAAILVSGLIAYIIHNAFIFDTSANFLVFFISAGFIYWLTIKKSIGQDRSKAIKANTPMIYVVAGIMSVIVVITIYITDIKPTLANYASTRAIVASWAGDYDTAISKFQEALDYNTFGSYEIRHSFGQTVVEHINSIKPLSKAQGALLLVIDHIKNNFSYSQDYLPYLYISRAYILLGKDDPASPYNDLALENSLKALAIAPKFVRTYYEIAQAYLNKKDYTQALKYFQKAVELNPDVGISYWYAGVIQIEAGNTDKGIGLVDLAMKKGYHLSEPDCLRMVSTYSAKNDYPRIAVVYERLTQIKSDNPQYHASLAATYAKLGRIDEAILQTKMAVELDPSFEKEAREFISKLTK